MSEATFQTVRTVAEATLEEKRSVFIAACRRVESEAEAEAFLRERRRAHPDARHTVHAFLLRDGKCRFSDDGEPQGSSGAPTLEIIRRAGLSDVCVATTRYFGGILLGTGGLLRAYSAAAKAALSAAGTLSYLPFTECELALSYPDYQRLRSELPRWGARERGTAFADGVTLTLGVPAAVFADFARRVADLTAGKTQPRALFTRPDVENL